MGEVDLPYDGDTLACAIHNFGITCKESGIPRDKNPSVSEPYIQAWFNGWSGDGIRIDWFNAANNHPL